ncbi:MAG: hypothetical protein KGD64_04970, partial [Candidatus Heimdallarchaeota archaeon]|nr:hypothetical protein [Candidatus Heimdallarchaeota archaeon]
AFEAGLGTIIRSAGHAIATIVVIFDDNYDWITYIKKKNHFQLKIINKLEYNEYSLDFFTDLFSKKNMTILIANIDHPLQSNSILIEDFIKSIVESKQRNEIIITSERDISEIANIANYVSFFSFK